uniref:Uncharacterized protein n=1 Tax=Rhizophora mucronata TaxID=61149 RepID=A0A2P2IU19_RHIMU
MVKTLFSFLFLFPLTTHGPRSELPSITESH